MSSVSMLKMISSNLLRPVFLDIYTVSPHYNQNWMADVTSKNTF